MFYAELNGYFSQNLLYIFIYFLLLNLTIILSSVFNRLFLFNKNFKERKNFMNYKYHEEEAKKNILKLRKKLKELPPYCKDFILNLETTTTTRTRLGYVQDMQIFFHFLLEMNPLFENKTIHDITLNDLDQLTISDIDEYMSWLDLYYNGEKENQNKNPGKYRKISSLRTFYSYFCKVERMKSNPAALANTPKLPEHDIVILEPNEVAEIIDYAESGEKLTKTQKRYAPLTRLRDVAVLVLLLGTGIRVSECVGLDLTHFDFKNNTFTVIRKGGKENRIYFGEEVRQALLDYLEEGRPLLKPSPEESALFLSIQHKRISVRAVQDLVKKYGKMLETNKSISPHKLRHTFGTNIYQETGGDIYAAAELLGHSSIETTRKHYAKFSNERRKQLSNIIKLR